MFSISDQPAFIIKQSRMIEIQYVVSNEKLQIRYKQYFYAKRGFRFLYKFQAIKIAYSFRVFVEFNVFFLTSLLEV